MKCNIYSGLGIVSIILIISIMILLYYKNMKDNNMKINKKNINEGFYDNLDDLIADNNKLLNTNINNLVSRQINISSNPDIIDKEFFELQE